jgi:hypothetical protein
MWEPVLNECSVEVLQIDRALQDAVKEFPLLRITEGDAHPFELSSLSKERSSGRSLFIAGS